MKNFVLFLPFSILLVVFLFQGLNGRQHTWWFNSGGVISVGSGHISFKWARSIIDAFKSKAEYEKRKSLDSFADRFFDRRGILPHYSTPPGGYSLRIPIWMPVVLVFFILFSFRSKKSSGNEEQTIARDV